MMRDTVLVLALCVAAFAFIACNGTPEGSHNTSSESTSQSSSFSSAATAQDYKAYFPFSGTILDQSSQAHTAVNHGAVFCIDRKGQSNSALWFNGTNSYLEIADHDDFSLNTTGSLTVSAWIAPDILYFPYTEGSGYVLWMGKGETSQHEWTFRMYSYTNTENRTNRTSCYIFNQTGGLGTGSYVEEPLTPGQWMHFALILDNYKIYLYKNGVLKDSDVYTNGAYIVTNYQNGTAPVRIGTRNLASYFLGKIDDVRFYSRVLSTNEIKALAEE